MRSGVDQSDCRRLFTRLAWPAETLGETVVQCRPVIPDHSGLQMVENPEASVSFNVVEEEEEEYYEYDYEDQYDYSGYETSNEEIVLTDHSLQHDEAPGDATRAEALPDQLPHDSEPSESLDAISPGPRTLTAGLSSGRVETSHWSDSSRYCALIGCLLCHKDTAQGS